MFEKLRRKLTLIYTLVAMAFLIIFGMITFYVAFLSLYEEEAHTHIHRTQHEFEEYINSGELPVSPENLASEHQFAYLVGTNGEVRIDQLTSTPNGLALLVKRDKWPRDDNATPLIFVRDADNKLAIYMSSVAYETKTAGKTGALYLFTNLTPYSNALVSAAILLSILMLIFIVFAAYISYYLAGNVIQPIQRSYEQQQQFSADASHELRTPLSVLNLSVDALQKEESLQQNAFATTLLQSMKEECQQMQRLLSILLRLAQNNDQPAPLEYSTFDMREAVTATTNQLRLLAANKEIAINNQLPATAVEITADKEALSQVLRILLDNAIKYSSEHTHITVCLQSDKSSLQLTVSDEGIGLSPTDTEHIFDRFFRVDKARSRSQGSFGLGLSIAQAIVRNHQGKISVASIPGQGSTFTIVLPLEPA